MYLEEIIFDLCTDLFLGSFWKDDIVNFKCTRLSFPMERKHLTLFYISTRFLTMAASENFSPFILISFFPCSLLWLQLPRLVMIHNFLNLFSDSFGRGGFSLLFFYIHLLIVLFYYLSIIYFWCYGTVTYIRWLYQV